MTIFVPDIIRSIMRKALLTLVVLVSCMAGASAQSFMDNTFIDGLVGVNQYFGNGTTIGAGTDVFFGKWFTPAFAARLGWHGHFGKQNSSHVVRGDLMLNLTSNSSDLAVIPFMSVGGDFHPAKNHNLLIGFGGEFAFSLAEKLQLIIDIAISSDFDPDDAGVIPFFCNPCMPAGIGIRYKL